MLVGWTVFFLFWMEILRWIYEHCHPEAAVRPWSLFLTPFSTCFFSTQSFEPPRDKHHVSAAGFQLRLLETTLFFVLSGSLVKLLPLSQHCVLVVQRNHPFLKYLERAGLGFPALWEGGE